MEKVQKMVFSPKTLAHLVNRHAGRAIWICGTGPSLDALDLAEITGPRIFINRAAFVLPASRGESYWQVLDDAWGMNHPGDWHGFLAKVRSGLSGVVGVFRDPLATAGSDRSPAPRGENIVLWDGSDPQDPGLLTLSRDEVAARNKLYTWIGGACTAVHLAWLMGARRIILVGIDGTSRGYADRVAGQYEGPGAGNWRPPGFGYGHAKVAALQAAKAMGLEVEDFSGKSFRESFPERVEIEA